jgi:hypothetical protein
MPRTLQDAKLDTRSARFRLKQSREPTTLCSSLVRKVSERTPSWSPSRLRLAPGTLLRSRHINSLAGSTDI